MNLLEMSSLEKKEWEIKHSSFCRKGISYEECKELSCKSILDRVTRIDVGPGEIAFIPKGRGYHFIGRVDTSGNTLIPQNYYKNFAKRYFVGQTLVNNANYSHYQGEVFFVYDLYPEDIVHVFPMDSYTDMEAKEESKLTIFPSLWLSGEELEKFTAELKVYNQITVKTKRNGDIIKPFAVLCFETPSKRILEIAELFKIGTIVAPPDDDAIFFDGELLTSEVKLDEMSDIFEKRVGISPKELREYI